MSDSRNDYSSMKAERSKKDNRTKWKMKKRNSLKQKKSRKKKIGEKKPRLPSYQAARDSKSLEEFFE